MKDPQQEFEINTGDWFALGQIFMEPYCFDDPNSGTATAQTFGVNMGMQALAAMDIASEYTLLARPLPKIPDAITSADVLGFLDEIFRKHGMPRVGILVSESVWMSSTEMLLDETTSGRADFLKQFDVEIAPMARRDKDEIVQALGDIGLRCAFSEGELNQQ